MYTKIYTNITKSEKLPNVSLVFIQCYDTGGGGGGSVYLPCWSVYCSGRVDPVYPGLFHRVPGQSLIIHVGAVLILCYIREHTVHVLAPAWWSLADRRCRKALK